MPCNMVGKYQHFGGNLSVYHIPQDSNLDTDWHQNHVMWGGFPWCSWVLQNKPKPLRSQFVNHLFTSYISYAVMRRWLNKLTNSLLQSEILILKDSCVKLKTYLSSYIGQTNKVALLLDYDGTLAPIAPHPDLAILPVETKNVLQRLSNMPDVYIAIISGRNVNNVINMVSFISLCVGRWEVKRFCS
jgi:hypothetical protein